MRASSLLISHHQYSPADTVLGLLPLLGSSRPFAVWATTLQVRLSRAAQMGFVHHLSCAAAGRVRGASPTWAWCVESPALRRDDQAATGALPVHHSLTPEPRAPGAASRADSPLRTLRSCLDELIPVRTTHLPNVRLFPSMDSHHENPAVCCRDGNRELLCRVRHRAPSSVRRVVLCRLTRLVCFTTSFVLSLVTCRYVLSGWSLHRGETTRPSGTKRQRLDTT